MELGYYDTLRAFGRSRGCAYAVDSGADSSADAEAFRAAFDACLLYTSPVRSDHKVGVVLQGSLYKVLGGIRVQCVITVRKLEIVALRKGKPGIPRAGNTLVLLIHHHDAGCLLYTSRCV